MIVAASDDYIGRTLVGKYRVEQMLGEGGMGKVYKATQLGIDRPIVLKVLRQALLGDERTVRRFKREAKAASRLNHPNSIGIIDFGEAEDGALYIAMEYVAGKDLHHILSREWPLPEPRVIRIVGQVLSALADAHSAGVIHRDLKPENIMVEQRRGEPDFVKVLDFGIAKIMDGDGDDGPALTRAGFVCGTPEYMSPEQARGAQLDHRSDLYAVGVILYQLCSGLLPFDSDSAVGFATKHLTEQPPPPTRRRPEARISAQMEKLIMRALAKSPDDRPQTAEQFRAELQAIDKERRGAAPSRRGASNTHASQGGRRATPMEQVETRITGGHAAASEDNPWGTADSTVRAEPTHARGHAGPVPSSARSRGSTSPDRTRPGVDLTTDEQDSRASRVGTRLFQVATALLTLIALGLAGAYAVQVMRSRSASVPDVPRDGQGGGGPAAVNVPATPLWELQVPLEQRDGAFAKTQAHEGDKAWSAGNLEAAKAAWESAFRKDPQPSTMLKLGELYFQSGDHRAARAMWTRHTSEHGDSQAIGYINERLNEMGAH